VPSWIAATRVAFIGIRQAATAAIAWSTAFPARWKTGSFGDVSKGGAQTEATMQGILSLRARLAGSAGPSPSLTTTIASGLLFFNAASTAARPEAMSTGTISISRRPRAGRPDQ